MMREFLIELMNGVWSEPLVIACPKVFHWGWGGQITGGMAMTCPPGLSAVDSIQKTGSTMKAAPARAIRKYTVRIDRSRQCRTSRWRAACPVRVYSWDVSVVVLRSL